MKNDIFDEENSMETWVEMRPVPLLADSSLSYHMADRCVIMFLSHSLC
jgi:hypothetical protein